MRFLSYILLFGMHVYKLFPFSEIGGEREKARDGMGSGLSVFAVG